MGNEDKYAQYPERPSDSRVRYFDGQFLGSQDFIDEQRYHIDRVRRLTALLRVRGVSEGLGVTSPAVLKLKIDPGTAIDERGRQLVLLTPREVALPADIVKPAQYVLCLTYAQLTDRTMGGTAEQKGTRGDTRFRDDVTVGYYGVGKAAPDGSIALALLTIDGAGAIAVTYPADVRVYSGLRLGGPGSPTLTVFGDPRPKDAVLAGNLRVQGTLSVSDGIIQNGPTPLGGTTDLGLYSQVANANLRLVSTGGPIAFFSDGGIGSNRMHEFAANADITFALTRNPLRLSGAFTNYADASKSEISNDTNQFKSLMLVGNSSGGAGRVVGVWDHLNVAGRARVGSTLSVGEGIIHNSPNPLGGTADLGLYQQTAGNWMRFVTNGGPFKFFADGGVGTKALHEFAANGDLTLNMQRNPLRLSSGFTDYADATKAEISNDNGQFKCLMILGNNSAGGGRLVGVWDHLSVNGRLRVLSSISVNNGASTRGLQIGGFENGVGVDSSDVSPNAGYIRFGDNTGWRLHFARSKDAPNAALNQGPGAALMTVHDSGQVGIGTVNPSGQVRLRLHTPTAANTWSGRLVAGGDQSVVVAGEFNNLAVLGAHNAALNAWQDVYLNPYGARVCVGTVTPETATLTVQGTTVLRTGGNGGWDRLVVTTTKDWGDGDAQYVTLGAGGATGVMFSNPHVAWRASNGSAAIRYGRAGGTASNTYWDVGVRGDGSFSFYPVDNNSIGNTEQLRLDRGGFVTVGNRAPLRFSQGWTGFPDGNSSASEISNDIDGYKTLMIIGNKSAGAERRVGMWDRVDVNGTLNINGNGNANGAFIVNQRGAWDGLRVTNHTNRGVFMNLCYEGDNNTFILYHQNAQGQYMRQDGVWQRNSDRSLKHDITDMHDALELALKLRPVRYKWNATGTPCLGFIAQEVQPLFPEIVSEMTHGTGDESRKVLGVKYDTFGVIAIAAVQQLKQELEAKIAALDAQLRELAGVRR